MAERMVNDARASAPVWLSHLEDVPGWLEPEEALLLCALAARRQAFGRCVELGAYQGRSAIALSAGIPDGQRILSVDTFGGSAEHQAGGTYFDPATLRLDGSVDTLPLFLANLTRTGLAHRVEVCRMSTVDAAAWFQGQVALLFVDADHAYDSVCADVEAWRPHLCPGAVLVLHDVGDWEGPTRCAADLLSEGFTRVDQAGTALALRTPEHWGQA